MNIFKKQEIAMYTTGGLSLIILGIITGAWYELLQMLALAGSIMFIVYALYKITYSVLDRFYPTNTNTLTKGGNTITVNYNCENRN